MQDNATVELVVYMLLQSVSDPHGIPGRLSGKSLRETLPSWLVRKFERFVSSKS